VAVKHQCLALEPDLPVALGVLAEVQDFQLELKEPQSDSAEAMHLSTVKVRKLQVQRYPLPVIQEGLEELEQEQPLEGLH